MTKALLPPWHGPAEAALADTATAFPLPVPIPALWDPAQCPAALLPYLAWTLDAEEFDPADPVDLQRNVIRQAIRIHRERGTRAGVRRALVATGFGDAQITERYGAYQLGDGSPRTGALQRTAADHWAEFRVTLRRPVSIAQANRARAIITRAAPARSHLKVLDFSEAAILLGSAPPRNGTYTRGFA